jgi:hypothetical protein
MAGSANKAEEEIAMTEHARPLRIVSNVPDDISRKARKHQVTVARPGRMTCGSRATCAAGDGRRTW